MLPFGIYGYVAMSGSSNKRRTTLDMLEDNIKLEAFSWAKHIGKKFGGVGKDG